MASTKGEIVLAEAVGLGRVESTQPMRLDSIFRIYSMIKAITSVAVMQLVEREEISLDAPISKYLPEFEFVRVATTEQIQGTPNSAVSIPTVRDLLGYGKIRGVRLLKEETVREMARDHLPVNAFPISVNGQKRNDVGFGLGFSVVVEGIPGSEYVPRGEYGWGGAASTHFWISPKDELAVVVLSQIKPFTFQWESAVKPIVYAAIRQDRMYER